MKIWAIGDLHLSFGTPNKEMDIFGDEWCHHTEKIRSAWLRLVAEEDLVLIPGDISWAKHLTEVVPDLAWIDNLPGTKVIIKGNHDYWWSSLKKMEAILPSSVHVINNNSFEWQGVAIGGVRLWDDEAYNFNDIIEMKVNPQAKEQSISFEKQRLIFQRDLQRLELSLKELPQQAKLRIAMTHYPPINLQLQPSATSQILEKYNIDICVFGHLHSLKKGLPPLFGTHNNIQYILTSCDYLDFTPTKIFEC